jgi:hypothetical protein
MKHVVYGEGSWIARTFSPGTYHFAAIAVMSADQE